MIMNIVVRAVGVEKMPLSWLRLEPSASVLPVRRRVRNAKARVRRPPSPSRSDNSFTQKPTLHVLGVQQHFCLRVLLTATSSFTMPVSRAERLAQIRALRAAGKTGFDAYEVQEAESIYDTVDDEGYKKVVRGRLDQDDFVVDDNGEGYVDDGREDWQDERRPASTDSESDEDLPKQSKAGAY